MSSKRATIAKNIALMLHDGDVVNLGIGLPTMVSNYLPDGMTILLHGENGCIGQDRELPYACDFNDRGSVTAYLRAHDDAHGGWRTGHRDLRNASAVSGLKRIEGQTMGIVGLGRIGQSVAKKAHGFDMRVIACDPFLPLEVAEKFGVQMVDLDTLLAESSVVSIHMNLTPENYHMFNKETFLKMKKQPILINEGRGPMVSEDDLVWALDNGYVRAAGLDMLESEYPDLDKCKLMGRDNVILNPHSGFCPTRRTTLSARCPCRTRSPMSRASRCPTAPYATASASDLFRYISSFCFATGEAGHRSVPGFSVCEKRTPGSLQPGVRCFSRFSAPDRLRGGCAEVKKPARRNAVLNIAIFSSGGYRVVRSHAAPGS